MSKKIYFSVVCLFLCSLCWGALEKKYVPLENIIFQDGHFLIVEGEHLVFVKSLHQDARGIYYNVSWYGECPNGHPYNPDGGCTGEDCPFN